MASKDTLSSGLCSAVEVKPEEYKRIKASLKASEQRRKAKEEADGRTSSPLLIPTEPRTLVELKVRFPPKTLHD